MGRPNHLAMLASLAVVPGMAVAQEGRAADRIPTIVVDGQASREVVPNLAVVTFGITADRPIAADASAQAARTAAALVDEVKASGIADKDVKTTETSLTPLFEPVKAGGDATRLKGFRATDMLQVRVRDLATTGTLVSRLVDKGANAVEGIDFSVDGADTTLDQLRGDATRDARRKAAIYADAAGVKLGRVIEILPEAAGPPLYLQRPKATSILAERAAPPPPVEAGTQTLEARVRITWELVP